MNTAGTAQRALLVSVLLAAVTMALYWPVRAHQFLDFDDNLYVTENPHVYSGLSSDNVAWAFTHSHASNWHPLTWLSHMMDVQVFGLNAGAHHLVNVLLHTVNALLLFHLLCGMTGAFWRSAVVAALFAWHPLHVESVAWVAERKDVLSTFFWLATMWLYHRHVRTPSRAPYAIMLFCFALGLMTKPMLVTLPCVLLLLDVWPLKRIEPWPEGAKLPKFDWAAWRLLLLEKAPMFLLVLAASVVTYLAQQGGGSVAQMQLLPLPTRLANAMISYAAYLGKMVWPVDLAPFYPLAPHWPWWQVVGALAVLLGLSFWVVKLAARQRYLLVGWLWYLGTLVPVIGLVQVGAQSMADRYTYIPLIGIFIMVVWAAAELAEQRGQLRPVLSGLAVVALVACLLTAGNYLKYWRDSITLFEHALTVTQTNPIAHTLLGNAYDKLAAASTGDAQKANYQTAIKHYQTALQMNPEFADGHFNLGDAYVRVGQPEQAEAEFRIAARLKPSQPDVFNNLGFVLASRQRYAEALTNYQYALKLLPNYTNAHNNMAVTLENLGRLDEAAVHYEQALQLDPNLAAAHANLGLLLARQNRMTDALPHFAEAVRLDPGNPQPQFHLGLVLLAQQKIPEALVHLRETVRLRPDWPPALHTLAWILATQENALWRNGTEAAALAERACALTGQSDPVMLDTLAAAYAEAGRFAEAITAAQKAKALAAGQGKLTEEIEGRLQLYRNNRPYREPAH